MEDPSVGPSSSDRGPLLPDSVEANQGHSDGAYERRTLASGVSGGMLLVTAGALVVAAAALVVAAGALIVSAPKQQGRSLEGILQFSDADSRREVQTGLQPAIALDTVTAAATAAALSRARRDRRADAWRDPPRQNAASDDSISATWESDHTWQWRWPDGKHFMLWHPPIPEGLHGANGGLPGSLVPNLVNGAHPNGAHGNQNHHGVLPAGHQAHHVLPADMTGNNIDISNTGAPTECILCTYWQTNYASQLPDVTTTIVHYAEGATLPCADRFYPTHPTNPLRFAAGTGGCECVQAQGSDTCPAPTAR